MQEEVADPTVDLQGNAARALLGVLPATGFAGVMVVVEVAVAVCRHGGMITTGVRVEGTIEMVALAAALVAVAAEETLDTPMGEVEGSLTTLGTPCAERTAVGGMKVVGVAVGGAVRVVVAGTGDPVAGGMNLPEVDGVMGAGIIVGVAMIRGTSRRVFLCVFFVCACVYVVMWFPWLKECGTQSMC